MQIKKALDRRRSEVERLAIWTSIRDEAAYDLDTDRPPMAPPRRPLHWPLAFPEVFRRRGSTASTPSSATRHSSGASGSQWPNGDAYREYLVDRVGGRPQRQRRPGRVLLPREPRSSRDHGSTVGFFATNTIAQGDTREVGLDQLLADGWHDLSERSKSRSGRAVPTSTISQVWLWPLESGPGRPFSTGTGVGNHAQSLERRSRAVGTAAPTCRERSARAFIGSIVLGIGFILEPVARPQMLIASDRGNEEVVFPVPDRRGRRLRRPATGQSRG